MVAASHVDGGGGIDDADVRDATTADEAAADDDASDDDAYASCRRDAGTTTEPPGNCCVSDDDCQAADAGFRISCCENHACFYCGPR